MGVWVYGCKSVTPIHTYTHTPKQKSPGRTFRAHRDLVRIDGSGVETAVKQPRAASFSAAPPPTGPIHGTRDCGQSVPMHFSALFRRIHATFFLKTEPLSRLLAHAPIIPDYRAAGHFYAGTPISAYAAIPEVRFNSCNSPSVRRLPGCRRFPRCVNSSLTSFLT